VRPLRWLIVALLVGAASACGHDPPDYQAIWSTTSAPPTTSTPPAAVPLWQFLEQSGVVGNPVAPEHLSDLTVTMPQPPGWAPYTNPNLALGTRMIAKGDTYPTAMLMVFELTGDFDANQAISHGAADAQLSENFKQLYASTDNFRGFPSSMVEGSYDLNGRRMQTYNRVVFATGAAQKPTGAGQPAPPPQRYLVQFTVTTYADKAAEEAPDIEAIISGFTVAPKA